MPDLVIDGLSKRFGGIVALDGVSFEVREGEIVGLIGPNGAGKTTVFNCISRFYDPDAGHIRFGGRDITHLGAHRVIEAGIAHYQMTGRKDSRMYNAAKKLADCWCRNISEAKKPWFGGHQELEQALVRRRVDLCSPVLLAKLRIQLRTNLLGRSKDNF